MKLRKSHVAEEWNEGHPDNGGDGYWIVLKSGWKWDSDPVGAVHSIHEDTKVKAWQGGVMRCQCSDCKSSLVKSENQKPFMQGYIAFGQGKGQSDNPFTKTSDDDSSPYWQWHAGWRKADREDEQLNAA